MGVLTSKPVQVSPLPLGFPTLYTQHQRDQKMLRRTDRGSLFFLLVLLLVLLHFLVNLQRRIRFLFWHQNLKKPLQLIATAFCVVGLK